MNRTAVILSVITIVILLFNNELLKPLIAKRTNIPIPIELIIIVGGTLLSKYMKMQEVWAIIPVGDIPVGLPQPLVPNFSLWKELLVDSFAIAFVSYSVTVSMALIFGQKLKYEIDFNQELLAMVSITHDYSDKSSLNSLFRVLETFSARSLPAFHSQLHCHVP